MAANLAAVRPMPEILTPNTLVTPALRLVRVLGRGSMGEVWEATSTNWGQVAVKFLAEGLRDPAAAGRFSREWEMASAIDSPHVVRMYALDKLASGRPFIVMEMVQGESLEELLARVKKTNPTETIRLLRQVADALDAAHALGIVHRDIKPENIVLCQRDRQTMVKVLDFGLAKPWSGGQTLTQVGMVMGTPYYMSPEQVRGGGMQLDHRADLWAFATVAFRMLVGELPFDADSLVKLVFKIVQADYRSVAELGGPTQTAAWFERAFKVDREQRFGSANEMVRELAALLEDETTLSKEDTITSVHALPTVHVSSEDTVDLDEDLYAKTRVRTALAADDDPELATAMRPQPMRSRSHTQVLPTQDYYPPEVSHELNKTIASEPPPALPPATVAPQPPPATATVPIAEVPPPTVPIARRGSSPARAAAPVRSHVRWLIAAAAVGVVGAGAIALSLDGDHHESEVPPLFTAPTATTSTATASPAPTSHPSTTGSGGIAQQPPPVATAAASATSSAAASSSAAAGTPAPPDTTAKPSADTLANDSRAHVTVRCTPACIVLLNGQRLGLSPVTDRRVSPGHYKIVAYRDDVGSRSKKTHLKAGTLTEVNFNMR